MKKLKSGMSKWVVALAVAGAACGSSGGKTKDSGAPTDANDAATEVAPTDTAPDVAPTDTAADAAQPDAVDAPGDASPETTPSDAGGDAVPEAASDASDAATDGDAAAVGIDALGCEASTDAFCQGVRIALFGNPGLNSASDFASYLSSNGQVVSRVQTTDAPTVTVALLSEYDVVILDQLVRSYTMEESQALRDWVAGGGALMSLTGYTGGGPDRDRPNTLLAAFGLQYVGNIVNGPVTMFVSHPTNQGLTSVTFSGGYLISTIDGVTGGTNTVTATLAGGTAAEAQERGAGRVFVWGDEWVEFDSEWQTMPEIRQFWVETLGWLEHLR